MSFEVGSVFTVKNRFNHYLGVMEIIRVTDDNLYAKFSPSSHYEKISVLMQEHEKNLTTLGPNSPSSDISARKILDLGISFHSTNNVKYTINAIFISSNNIMFFNYSDLQQEN